MYENIGGTDAEIITFSNGNAGKKIIGKEDFNSKFFSAYEISVLERVWLRFKDCTAGEISEISHNEDAWIANNQTKNIIRYDYGFKIKAL